MNIEFRQVTDNDLAVAQSIFNAAFGRTDNRMDEWILFQELQPGGRYFALEQGQPVGLVGLIDYERMAYLGTLAVLPEYQRRGIGRALMEYIIARVEERGPRTMLLEATPAGARLYPKLGFVVDGTTSVYRLHNAGGSLPWPGCVQRIETTDVESVAAFDEPIFGGNRLRVIRAYQKDLTERAFLTREKDGTVSGYLFAQRGRLGPWAAQYPEDAEALLIAALTLPFENLPGVVVPGANKAVPKILERHGFSFERSMFHMRLGGSGPVGQRALLYALASSGIG